MKSQAQPDLHLNYKNFRSLNPITSLRTVGFCVPNLFIEQAIKNVEDGTCLDLFALNVSSDFLFTSKVLLKENSFALCSQVAEPNNLTSYGGVLRPKSVHWANNKKCRRWDLNPQGVSHTNLNRARLPISPLRHNYNIQFSTLLYTTFYMYSVTNVLSHPLTK